MRSKLAFITTALLANFAALILFQNASLAAAPDCQKCHAKLFKGTVVHAAVSMGCETCHAALDASKVPHKKKNNIARGLSTDPPFLCYQCHPKEAFEKKNVHAAVSMGCTSCHNPHSSNSAKLLIADAPALCFTCHDQTLFSKKTVHAPVAGGMCLSCHVPHSSDEVKLLSANPFDVCLACHEAVTKKPHAIAGFSASGHPLGKPKKPKNDKPATIVMDPARPDRAFYCGSCHEPHGSDSPRLLRFNAKSSMSLCGNCHKM